MTRSAFGELFNSFSMRMRHTNRGESNFSPDVAKKCVRRAPMSSARVYEIEACVHSTRIIPPLRPLSLQDMNQSFRKLLLSEAIVSGEISILPDQVSIRRKPIKSIKYRSNGARGKKRLFLPYSDK